MKAAPRVLSRSLANRRIVFPKELGGPVVQHKHGNTPKVDMRVVLVSKLATQEKRLRGHLAPYGARVERVGPGPDLHLQLLMGATPSLVVIDAPSSSTTTSNNDEQLALCRDLRFRLVHRAQPEIVFLGQPSSHAAAISAFEAGVDNWIAATQTRVLSAQYHFVQCVDDYRERGPRSSEGIAFLEDLTIHSSGIVEMSDGVISARVSVRDGRVGAVHFPELYTSFAAEVELEVASRSPQLDALKRGFAFPVHDWDKALAEHGCWSRARLREALLRRWQRAVRWMAATDVLRVEWWPGETRVSEELSFEPFELLSALDEPMPHSFARGRLSFGAVHAENDLQAVP